MSDAHGMLPGSHERPSDPECRCGARWSYWLDECDAKENPHD